jgi:hypothetical protein
VIAYRNPGWAASIAPSLSCRGLDEYGLGDREWSASPFPSLYGPGLELAGAGSLLPWRAGLSPLDPVDQDAHASRHPLAKSGRRHRRPLLTTEFGRQLRVSDVVARAQN